MADVKKTLSVPYTEARLKPYIAIFMLPGGYDGTKDFSDADILTLSEGLIEVGSIGKFNYDNSREGSGSYRVFNRASPGSKKEAFPGLPNYELSLETVVFNKNTFFEILGYGAADVGYQDKPQIIQLQLISPGELPQRIWTYRSCWFEDNPYEWEASPSDMLMKQTIKIITAGVVEGKG